MNRSHLSIRQLVCSLPLTVATAVVMVMAGTTTASAANCGGTNNCGPSTFAAAVFTYPGINAPDTGANESAFQVWERVEGGNWRNSASCNPINTTEREPGSKSINSAHVQAYHSGNGHTCWD